MSLAKEAKDRCWKGYKPVPGKKPYSEGSCEKEKKACLAKEAAKKSEKPFHGYNPKVHSREGGLNEQGRRKAKREEGANLKPPVTERNPSGKRKKRKESFCARMSGVPGPTSKGGKLTRKGAALKRWRC